MVWSMPWNLQRQIYVNQREMMRKRYKKRWLGRRRDDRGCVWNKNQKEVPRANISSADEWIWRRSRGTYAIIINDCIHIGIGCRRFLRFSHFPHFPCRMKCAVITVTINNKIDCGPTQFIGSIWPFARPITTHWSRGCAMILRFKPEILVAARKHLNFEQTLWAMGMVCAIAFFSFHATLAFR